MFVQRPDSRKKKAKKPVQETVQKESVTETETKPKPKPKPKGPVLNKRVKPQFQTIPLETETEEKSVKPAERHKSFKTLKITPTPQQIKVESLTNWKTYAAPDLISLEKRLVAVAEFGTDEEFIDYYEKHGDRRLPPLEQSALYIASLNNSLKALKRLIKAGEDINRKCTFKERTPLHRCVIVGDWVGANLLLSNRANPSIEDYFGKTPMQYLTFKDLDSRLSNKVWQVLNAYETSSDLSLPTAEERQSSKGNIITSVDEKCHRIYRQLLLNNKLITKLAA